MKPLVLLVIVLSAAVATSTAAASTPDVSSMTLRLSDLPAGFTPKSSHVVSKAQVVKQQGSVMPGYVTGWESVFERSEGFNTAQINSSASWYRTPSQAHASMVDTYRRAAKQGKVTRVSVGAPLGDEGRAYKIPGTSGVTVYMVVWRYRNVKASLLFGGLPSFGATSAGATRMAVMQQRRIKEAM